MLNVVSSPASNTSAQSSKNAENKSSLTEHPSKKSAHAKGIELDITGEKNKKINGAQSIDESTQKAVINMQENATQKINLPSAQNSVRADMQENPIEISEQQALLYETEFSESMTILNESSALLFAQTKYLLKREAFRNPTASDVEVALNCMETLAKLVQTKVNFIKALR
jgi:hypothetical protein